MRNGDITCMIDLCRLEPRVCVIKKKLRRERAGHNRTEKSVRLTRCSVFSLHQLPKSLLLELIEAWDFKKALHIGIQFDFTAPESNVQLQFGPAHLEAPATARASRAHVACPVSVGPIVHGPIVVAHLELEQPLRICPKMPQHSLYDNTGPRPGRPCSARVCGRPLTNQGGPGPHS